MACIFRSGVAKLSFFITLFLAAMLYCFDLCDVVSAALRDVQLSDGLYVLNIE